MHRLMIDISRHVTQQKVGDGSPVGGELDRFGAIDFATPNVVCLELQTLAGF